MRSLVLALTGMVILSACSKKDDAITPPEDTGDVQIQAEPSSDQDGDGYDGLDNGGADCDDSDPDVYPGAQEIFYDGVDQNCNGNTDEYDLDGDGYGSSTYGGDDCNDSNAAIHPDVTETADGIDQDCDGVVDNVPTPPEGTMWHLSGYECGSEYQVTEDGRTWIYNTADWNDEVVFPGGIMIWGEDDNVLDCYLYEIAVTGIWGVVGTQTFTIVVTGQTPDGNGGGWLTVIPGHLF